MLSYIQKFFQLFMQDSVIIDAKGVEIIIN
jgi:hypothetical protein